jgi:hypothetical protein
MSRRRASKRELRDWPIGPTPEVKPVVVPEPVSEPEPIPEVVEAKPVVKKGKKKKAKRG